LSFHHQLCGTRILDPACGTGNFLYVSLELLKRLEGEVLEALADLGGQEMLRGLQGHTVDPHQFLGLEINPRAAAIAELVLWIGYLQWHMRTKGGMPDEPILRAFRNIKVQNAVLHADEVLARGEKAKPRTRRDADGAEAEVYAYANPRSAERRSGRRRISSWEILRSSVARTCARGWAASRRRRYGRLIRT
jgi:hypothetical protein